MVLVSVQTKQAKTKVRPLGTVSHARFRLVKSLCFTSLSALSGFFQVLGLKMPFKVSLQVILLASVGETMWVDDGCVWDSERG